MKKITKKHLKAWDACTDGYIRFNQLFPDGADLQTASAGLIADGHPEWSDWLWDKCKHNDDVQLVTQTTVTVGDHGIATAGKYGTAIAGNYGTTKAGEDGTAIAGEDGTAIAGDYGKATAGKYGKATAGDRGTATAGKYGTATAGDRGTATAGKYGTATAGDVGTAIAGDDGTATAGDHGTAIAGDDGTATAGDHGTAIAGDYGRATTGNYGVSTVGEGGTATAGVFGTATAGYKGTATAGEGGIITITFLNVKDTKYERKSANIGGKKGLKPNTPYRLDTKGNFVEANPTHNKITFTTSDFFMVTIITVMCVLVATAIFVKNPANIMFILLGMGICIKRVYDVLFGEK